MQLRSSKGSRAFTRWPAVASWCPTMVLYTAVLFEIEGTAFKRVLTPCCALATCFSTEQRVVAKGACLVCVAFLLSNINPSRYVNRRSDKMSCSTPVDKGWPQQDVSLPVRNDFWIRFLDTIMFIGVQLRWKCRCY